MHDLARLIVERFSEGVRNRSITSCSKWACQRRVMGQPFPGPWSFKHHPWAEEMHDSEAEMNIGQKSAQMAYTETALNRTFFNIDVKGIDCLYVLPAKTPDASDFSAARFDPALELSPHLAKIFSEVKNIGHKRAGTTNLYIRGSRSRAGLKSVPVGFIVLDELDEMTQENVPLALERASGQVEKMVWMISTATVDNTGINYHYNQSSQNHFFFKCPSCGRRTELVFPDSLMITGKDLDDPGLKNSHLICKECKAVLPHAAKTDWLATGKWVEGVSSRDAKGWHVNQLYSTVIRPEEIATLFIKAQTNKAHEQEFWNSKIGVPHVVEGARVTDKEIDSCLCGYSNGIRGDGQLVTMGVDVGSWIHFEIDEWRLGGAQIPGNDINIMSQCRVLRFGKVRGFDDLDELMQMWGIHFCVVDAQPERRKALEFANRWYGHVRVCWYPNGITGKTLHINNEEQSVSVDRTTWLDLSQGRFHRGKPWMQLPNDIDQEYRDQIKTPIRIYETDKEGNPIGRYIQAGNRPDHYAHARNYAEIALPLAANIHRASDITERVY